MRYFKKLRNKLSYLEDADIKRVEEAFEMARDAHKDQIRRNGDPYITHPVAVTRILADMHMDPECLMASLLHDVIEDCGVTKAEIAEKFNENVAELVDGVTKLTKIEFKTRAEQQAENLCKMILAMSKDLRVIIVKLADRLHNMRTISHLNEERRRRISRETLDIFAPIANRLGMHKVALELEKLGFQACYPVRYKILQKAVKQERGQRKGILNNLESLLRKSLKKHKVHVVQFVSREKRPYSIYRKILVRKRRHEYGPVYDAIADFHGYRIIVDSIEDCYRTLGVVHNLKEFFPDYTRFKDYIAIPKSNGYSSLHTILKPKENEEKNINKRDERNLNFEIQIRSREMHTQAEEGIAAHWAYKRGRHDVTQSEIRAQRWLRELINLRETAETPMEFVEHMKVDLFPDEVYVFTPAGRVIELPAEATALDFAYAIHTDIGNTCVAAKVDQQLLPLSTKLISGQSVEIITSNNGHPSPTWLNFTVTAKAQSCIRHYLKHQQKRESLELGKKLLKRALATRHLKLKKIPEEVMQATLKEAGLKNIFELITEIGIGNRIAMLEVNRIMRHMKSNEMDDERDELVMTNETHAEPLVIKGTEGMYVKYSKCCLPIPGDTIVGVLEAGEGIQLHIENCRQVHQHLKRTPDRVLPLQWQEGITRIFHTKISVEFVDQPYALSTASLAVSKARVNIHDVSVLKREGKACTIIFDLEVFDRKQLAEVMRHLRQLDMVKGLYRGTQSKP